MTKELPPAKASLACLPSVDSVLKTAACKRLADEYGHTQVRGAVREILARLRAAAPTDVSTFGLDAIAERSRSLLAAWARPSLRPVFNLSGVVLHTNLGRALLPQAAVEALVASASRPCNLEYDLENGARGDRDNHVESLLCKLTGAEAAVVVNNNAAAVWLLLNTLALRKEVIVSRGELIEIGGSFRLPDIMSRAGCRLREVGTTNRTHLSDYEEAVGRRTGLLLKVHTSNYVVQGFASAVEVRSLAALARQRGLCLAVDLGGGALIDLAKWGLPAEPTPQHALTSGASLVTFSGDKLLGGPQAGIIVGERALIARIRRNPVKRALRLDKLRIAALEAVLRLYRHPESLAQVLPTLRQLTRPLADIEASATRLLPQVQAALGKDFKIVARPSRCEIGSGSLPLSTLSSVCLAVLVPGRHKGAALKNLADAFRALEIPVIGRIEQNSFCLDLRCLEDEENFARILPLLKVERV